MDEDKIFIVIPSLETLFVALIIDLYTCKV